MALSIREDTPQNMGKYVVAILVETGEVIDYEVLSRHCFERKKHNDDDRCSEQYKKWMEGYVIKCHMNFQGSSGGGGGGGWKELELYQFQKIN